MGRKIFTPTGRTGETITEPSSVYDLDAISASALTDGDIAIVADVSGNVIDIYGYDSTGTAATSDPEVIRPYDYSTGGNWVQLLARGSALPSGMINWFAGPTAPLGYLECDGSAVSRTTYASLFSAIGTTFGTGDGSTTFNLPDLRGEFIRGWDNSKGTDSGRTFGSSQADELKSHRHESSATDTYSAQLLGAGATGAAALGYYTGYTGGAETRPRNIALLPCIKI